MDTLFTIAVPRLAAGDARWIEGLRAAHDLAAPAPVPPHFTLLFGCDAVPVPEYTAHVEAVAARHEPVAFVCRHAMVFPGSGSGHAHVFLVPDEGRAALARLHDELYTGPLQPQLRLGIPFIPHITIASGQAPQDAQALCNELNAGRLALQGTVDALTIGALRAGMFWELSAVPLLNAVRNGPSGLQAR